MEDIIKKYEQSLRCAMLNSDVDKLDKLISDDLIFVTHFGQICSKSDDLNSHKNGLIKIIKLDIINQTVRMFDNIAVCVSEVNADAVIGEKQQSDRLMYMRVWQKSGEEWKLISGQATRIL